MSAAGRLMPLQLHVRPNRERFPLYSSLRFRGRNLTYLDHRNCLTHCMRSVTDPLMRSSEGLRVELFYGSHAGDQTPYPRFFSAHLRMRLDSPPSPIAGLRTPVASGLIPHLTLGTGKGSAKLLGISGGKMCNRLNVRFEGRMRIRNKTMIEVML